MMATQLQPVIDHLWQSTLFAALAGLLVLAFRKNLAQVRYYLWLAASLKFLIPFSILVQLGNLFRWVPVVPVVRSELPVLVEFGQPFVAPMSVVATSSAVEEAGADVVLIVIGSVWAMGFIALVFSWMLRWSQVRTVLREATPLRLPIGVRAMSSPALMEPGVFGIYDPVLLLPEGITDHLTPVQMEAILAHELCHVRRRDNLSAALHMVVESVFWFHPVVWFLGARLAEERERACDEDVIRKGHSPTTYAEGILRICELYLAPPTKCVAGVTGSNLKKRIGDIMRSSIGLRLDFGRIALLVAAAIAVVAAPIAIGVVQATVVRPQSERTIPALAQLTVTDPKRSAPTEMAQAPPLHRTAKSAPQMSEQVAPVVRAVLGAQADVRGKWLIQNPALVGPRMTPFPGRMQLTFYSPGVDIPVEGRSYGNGGTSKSLVFDAAIFRGLALAQIDSPVKTAARFDIVREAGTFVCEGDFEAGIGVGTFLFQPNPDFRGEMLTLGLQDVDEGQFFWLALHEAGPRYVGELRAAAITVSTVSQLIAIWNQGLTSEYLREIQQLGYRPNGDEWVKMRIQGVTPDFAREMRQTQPSVSIQDLIDVRTPGVRSSSQTENNPAVHLIMQGGRGR
jgi:beta-lactamase regulating signal transducer with metallopeptidase domain